MALSRKQKRKLNRLRRDAESLWGEQQQVITKMRDLYGRAGESARDYAQAEVVPAIRKGVDANIRPAFDRGVEGGRRAYHNVSDTVQHAVLPTLVQAGGNVSGAVREFVGNNKTLQQVQSRGQDFAKDATSRVQKLQAELMKQEKKKKKSGPGVGGWFLIGAGVAALAAVGYALWQTFRADDDLWIADEELDAPVQTVTREN